MVAPATNGDRGPGLRVRPSGIPSRRQRHAFGVREGPGRGFTGPTGAVGALLWPRAGIGEGAVGVVAASL